MTRNNELASQSANIRASSVALFIVLAIAVLNCVVFYPGYCVGDAVQYLPSAYRMATGKLISWLPVGNVRLGLTVPAMVTMKLTNFNLFAVSCFFLLLFVLTVYGVYRLALLLSVRPWTAVFAAWLTAMCPLCVKHATMVFPDVPIACYTLYAFLLVVVAGRINVSRRGGRAVKLGVVAGAGILVGMAYTCKVTGLLVLPLLVLFIVYDEWIVRRKKLSWPCLLEIAVLLGVITIVVLIETEYLAAITGERRIRLLNTVSAVGRTVPGGAHPEVSYILGNRSPGRRFAILLEALSSMGPVLKWLLLASPLAFPFVPGRSWKLWTLFVWFVGYYTWGSMSLTHYVPPFLHARYCIVFVPFGLIMAAMVLGSLLEFLWGRASRFPRVARTGLIVIPAGAIFLIAGDSYREMNFRYDEYRGAEVKTVFRILDELLEEDDRFIILSSYLSRSLAPLFSSGHDDRIIPTTPDTRVADVSSYMNQLRGCYYVESAIENSGAREQRWGLDNELDAMVESQIKKRQTDTGFVIRDYRTVSSLEDRTETVLSLWFPDLFHRHDYLDADWRRIHVRFVQPAPEKLLNLPALFKRELGEEQQSLLLAMRSARLIGEPVSAAELVGLADEYATRGLIQETQRLYRLAISKVPPGQRADPGLSADPSNLQGLSQAFFEDWKGIAVSFVSSTWKPTIEEVATLVETSGGKVATSLPGGETSSCGIVALSAGANDGDQARVYVNAKDFAEGKRGYSLVVLNENRSGVASSHWFDLYAGQANATAMAGLIESLPPGSMVAGAVCDEGSRNMTTQAWAALRKLGVESRVWRQYRSSFAFIGVKGSKPGSALEILKATGNGPALVALIPGRTKVP